MQLHVPYSEHAKAPVGPIAMGLPLAMDPKKLGKDPGPPALTAGAHLSPFVSGGEGGQFGLWDSGRNMAGRTSSPWVGRGGGPCLRIPALWLCSPLSPIPSAVQRSEAGAAVPTGPGRTPREPGGAYGPGDIRPER